LRLPRCYSRFGEGSNDSAKLSEREIPRDCPIGL
jgi:hypothetical protein